MNRHGGLSGRWIFVCLAISTVCLALGLGFRNGGLEMAANIAGLMSLLPLVATLVRWASQRDDPRTVVERMIGVRSAGLSPPMMWLAVLTLAGVTIALAVDYILTPDPPPARPGWVYTSAGDIGPTALAVTESAVYAGTWRGMLYALDPRTDAIRWSLQLADSRAKDPRAAGFGIKGLAVYDNTVYATTDYGVHAVDVSTETIRWNYLTDGAIDDAPLAANGGVFFGTFLGEVMGFHSDTGEQRFMTDTDTAIDTRPVLDGGTLYVVDAGGKVSALDAWSGKRLWQQKLGGMVFSASPALANGILYVGNKDKKLDALDAQTGKPLWTFPMGDVVDSSPVVANGTVYVGCDDGNLYAVDAVTGVKRWQYPTNDDIDTAPVVISGVVYVGSLDSQLHAVDAATGTVKWTFPVGAPMFSSPVVANGKVYVAAGGRVRAIDATTGRD